MPEVLAVDHDCLILPWVEPGKPTADAAAEFGRALARRARGRRATSSGPCPTATSAGCRCPTATAPTWAEFFATRRVLPYLKLARDRGAVTPEQAAASRPWSAGSTTWSRRSRRPGCTATSGTATCSGATDGVVWLVDPAAYAGHRETDLAMLALFGLPHLPRVLDAYDEASPLADGWEERVGLHQLFPLLVHAAMFGGGYGARAAALASRY